MFQPNFFQFFKLANWGPPSVSLLLLVPLPRMLFLHIFLPLRFLLKCHLFREAFLATPI